MAIHSQSLRNRTRSQSRRSALSSSSITPLGTASTTSSRTATTHPSAGRTVVSGTRARRSAEAIEPQEQTQHHSSNCSTVTDLPTFTGYSESANPLSEFVPDALFADLLKHDLINPKSLRDFIIRRTYQRMREELHLSRRKAIQSLQKEYPYLQQDTLLKIVYRIANPKKSVISVWHA